MKIFPFYKVYIFEIIYKYKEMIIIIMKTLTYSYDWHFAKNVGVKKFKHYKNAFKFLVNTAYINTTFKSITKPSMEMS